MSSTISTQAKRSPGDFLKSVVGKPVSVRLTSGSDCRGMLYFFPSSLYQVYTIFQILTPLPRFYLLLGILVCLDPFMNIALEQAEEWENGTLVQKYGDCFLRGNNVLFVSALKRK